MPTVLLVEDDEANRDMLRRRLERHGYQVQIAVNGDEGVQLATAMAPDLMIMDMSMPVLSGWQATRRLKTAEATRDIPIIALTAYSLPEDRHRALRSGCDAYQAKPVDFASLINLIEECLQQPESARI